jgi:predicted transcriptional regulator
VTGGDRKQQNCFVGRERERVLTSGVRYGRQSAADLHTSAHSAACCLWPVQTNIQQM